MDKSLKMAERLLNYRRIGFFEEQSINLLAVLLHKKGTLENIDVNRDLDLIELLKDEVYSEVLRDFQKPLENRSYVQIFGLLYDVKHFLGRKEFDPDYGDLSGTVP